MRVFREQLTGDGNSERNERDYECVLVPILVLIASLCLARGDCWVARQQNAMSCAILSPTHGWGEYMEVGCRALRYRPPLKPGMASKIDMNRDDFDCLNLGHIARLLSVV